MDYSLLLGIEEVSSEQDVSEEELVSTCGQYKYHIKIIDYL